MRFKILMFDGRPVKTVLDDRIVFNDPDDVTLLPATITMLKMENNTVYKEPWKSKRAALVRKCELEDVELMFLKKI
jgi:hypothetical protein